MKLVIDIETTGFNKYKDDIIQLGCVEVLDDFTLGREYNTYLRPIFPENFSSQDIHGINLTTAMLAPTRRDALIDFMYWLLPLKDKFPLQFIYHGTGHFDFEFLKHAFVAESFHEQFHKIFKKDMVINTASMVTEKIGSEYRKLNQACSYFNIEFKHHNALEDARATALLYCRLKQTNEQMELL